VRDNGNILILCTLVMPMSLTCARNCPMCSYVVLASSPVNLAKFGTRKPHGYGIVSKYLGYGFWYDLVRPSSPHVGRVFVGNTFSSSVQAFPNQPTPAVNPPHRRSPRHPLRASDVVQPLPPPPPHHFPP
jgi:hypothetical protein